MESSLLEIPLYSFLTKEQDLTLLKKWAKILEESKDSFVKQIAIAQIHRVSNNYKDALRIVKNINAKNPTEKVILLNLTAKIYRLLAWDKNKLNDDYLSGCRRCYELALCIMPSNGILLCGYGFLLTDLHEYDKAKIVLFRAFMYNKSLENKYHVLHAIACVLSETDYRDTEFIHSLYGELSEKHWSPRLMIDYSRFLKNPQKCVDLLSPIVKDHYYHPILRTTYGLQLFLSRRYIESLPYFNEIYDETCCNEELKQNTALWRSRLTDLLLVQYAQNLMNIYAINPSKKSIFISYAWNDNTNKDYYALISRIVNMLYLMGFKVLFDKHSVNKGSPVISYINNIDTCNFILVFVSKLYLSKLSKNTCVSIEYKKTEYRCNNGFTGAIPIITETVENIPNLFSSLCMVDVTKTENDYDFIWDIILALLGLQHDAMMVEIYKRLVKKINGIENDFVQLYFRTFKEILVFNQMLRQRYILSSSSEDAEEIPLRYLRMRSAL